MHRTSTAGRPVPADHARVRPDGGMHRCSTSSAVGGPRRRRAPGRAREPRAIDGVRRRMGPQADHSIGSSKFANSNTVLYCTGTAVGWSARAYRYRYRCTRSSTNKTIGLSNGTDRRWQRERRRSVNLGRRPAVAAWSICAGYCSSLQSEFITSGRLDDAVARCSPSSC